MRWKLSPSERTALLRFYPGENIDMGQDLSASDVSANGMTVKSLARRGFLKAKSHISWVGYEITEEGRVIAQAIQRDIQSERNAQ